MGDKRTINIESYSELYLWLDVLYFQGYSFIDNKKHTAIDLYLLNVDRLIIDLINKKIEYLTNENKKIKMIDINDINMKILNRSKESEFYDLEITNKCNHPEHDPPMYINIPSGKGYKHVCPLCGKVTNVEPLNITY